MSSGSGPIPLVGDCANRPRAELDRWRGEDRFVSTRLNTSRPQEPSPFRFAEIAQQAGIDFVHVSGMTEAKHTSRRRTARGWRSSTTTTTASSTSTSPPGPSCPPGTCADGHQPALPEPGRQPLRGRDPGVGPGLSRASATASSSATSTTTATRTSSCATTGRTCSFSTTATARSGTSAESAGIDGPDWSSGGAFLDYDNDGDLDLYVTNYGHWKLPDDEQVCGQGARPEPTAPHVPSSRRRHILYRNNGEPHLHRCDRAAGVARTDGRGLGVVAADLNGDGRIDLYVANDMCPNFVFLNRGDGTFEDVTESSGAGYDAHGQTHAGMGVDAEDVDGDGRPDLFVTNFWNEPNSLFMNLGGRPVRGPDAEPAACATTARPGSAGAVPWPISTTTAGPTASSPTATSTTTSNSWGTTAPTPTPLAAPQRRGKAVPTGDPRRRALFRLRSRRARGRVWRPGRRRRPRSRRQSQGRRPGSAAERHADAATTGSAFASWAREAIATRSVPASRSTGDRRSSASGKAAAASDPLTIPGS